LRARLVLVSLRKVALQPVAIELAGARHQGKLFDRT
jgi:hypothetical protein